MVAWCWRGSTRSPRFGAPAGVNTTVLRVTLFGFVVGVVGFVVLVVGLVVVAGAAVTVGGVVLGGGAVPTVPSGTVIAGGGAGVGPAGGSGGTGIVSGAAVVTGGTVVVVGVVLRADSSDDRDRNAANVTTPASAITATTAAAITNRRDGIGQDPGASGKCWSNHRSTRSPEIRPSGVSFPFSRSKPWLAPGMTTRSASCPAARRASTNPVDWLNGIGSMSPWNSSTGPVALGARASLSAASQRARTAGSRLFARPP